MTAFLRKHDRLLILALVFRLACSSFAHAGPSATTQAVDSEAPAWMGKRIAIQWGGLSVAEALRDLATRFGRPIWTSDAARRHALRTPVRLEARHLSGFGALSTLCEIAGLQWTWVDGAAAVTKPEESSVAWRLTALATQRWARQEHPSWLEARLRKHKADLNMEEVTLAAAMGRLGEAYGIDVYAPMDVLRSQKLITLRGQAVRREAALESLARQLDVRRAEAWGLVWLLPKDAPGLRTWAHLRASSRPSSAPGLTREAWVSFREGAVEARGRSHRIRAVRHWNGDAKAP